MGLFSSSNSSSYSSTASAERMRAAFERYMESKDIKYSVFDEDDNIDYLAFGGNRYETFVLVDFDEGSDCDSVHFSSNGFAKCDPGMTAQCYVKLNQLNKRFRWVKFWMDEDGDITCDTDILIHLDTVGADCMQIAIRMSNIEEDALEALEGTASMNKEMKQKLDLLAIAKRMAAGK